VKQTIEYLESFAVMTLIAMGLTGAVYHLFREGGWMETAGGNLVHFITNSPLLALAAILCTVILAHMRRHSSRFQRENGKAATGVFYAMLAAGAYFMGRLMLVGTL